MTCGIYAVQGEDGRRYIGASINIEYRWSNHRVYLKRGTHVISAPATFLILERCVLLQHKGVEHQEILDYLEQRWMDSTPTYLLANAADKAGKSGHPWSKEARKTASDSAIRFANTTEGHALHVEKAKTQHANQNFGVHTWTEDSRKRISEASRNGPGIKAAQEAAKITQTPESMSRRSYCRDFSKMTGRKLSEETRAKMRTAAQAMTPEQKTAKGKKGWATRCKMKSTLQEQTA
jgi:hypothetical protein